MHYWVGEHAPSLAYLLYGAHYLASSYSFIPLIWKTYACFSPWPTFLFELIKKKEMIEKLIKRKIIIILNDGTKPLRIDVFIYTSPRVPSFASSNLLVIYLFHIPKRVVKIIVKDIWNNFLISKFTFYNGYSTTILSRSCFNWWKHLKQSFLDSFFGSTNQKNIFEKDNQEQKIKRITMKRRARLERNRRRSLSSRNGSIEVVKKVKVLKKLVPNCESTKMENLFQETADYIMALQMQVKVMQVMVNVLQGTDEQY